MEFFIVKPQDFCCLPEREIRNLILLTFIDKDESIIDPTSSEVAATSIGHH